MRYTQPTILRTDNALAAIQSVGSPNPSKPLDFQLDTAVIPNQFTTPGAYDADE